MFPLQTAFSLQLVCQMQLIQGCTDKLVMRSTLGLLAPALIVKLSGQSSMVRKDIAIYSFKSSILLPFVWWLSFVLFHVAFFVKRCKLKEGVRERGAEKRKIKDKIFVNSPHLYCFTILQSSNKNNYNCTNGIHGEMLKLLELFFSPCHC